MIKALIIDDELSTLQVLRILIEKFVPEIGEVTLALGGPEGLEKIRSTAPDLVFLDIEMPELDGFDLLRQIPEPGFEVIFVTAYSHYAIQAIRFSAFDYLLKPVDTSELQQAVQRFAAERKLKNETGRRYDHLLQNILQKDKAQFTLSIRTLEGVHFLTLSDIVRCEADGNYTCFYLADKKKVMASKPMGEFEALLDPAQFFRVHKSFIVNRLHIQSLLHQGYLKMSDGALVEVSRRKMADVKAWLAY
ncbi:MAG TPA: LytTR family DNA-binding domain-containing protein [Saprospiraceae bacterium]|nr:LytTR family DNA-binding domain-containing protein [Saprospiraceae bacterium]